MNTLQDIINYIRRIIKSPSNSTVSDNLIINYIDRFYINDVDARIQVFDLKTTYKFQTIPGVDKYNMPLYSLQTEPGSQTVSFYPVYQGFTGNCLINGLPVSFSTQREVFNNYWLRQIQSISGTAIGDGTAGPYNLTLPITPNSANATNPPLSAVIRGSVDVSGVIATGSNIDPILGTTINTSIPTTSINSEVWITSIDSTGSNVVVCDSGQFLTSNVNCGLLMTPGAAPYGNTALSGGYSATVNTVNYLTGAVNVTFPVNIPAGNNINTQCRFFSCGLPRMALYYNNTLTLRCPPDRQYSVELDAYLTPAAFLSTSSAIPFGYMSEYIARGAAQKMLSDTENWVSYDRYERLFIEQEHLVWKRSQRQNTATRTPTIFSEGRQGFYGGMLSNIGSSI